MYKRPMISVEEAKKKLIEAGYTIEMMKNRQHLLVNIGTINHDMIFVMNDEVDSVEVDYLIDLMNSLKN